MGGEVKTKATLDAEKIAVDAGKIATVGAQNFVVLHAQGGLATVRAVGADSGDVMHFPRARFVAVGAAGQRADGANIDTHTTFFAVEVVAAIRNNDGVRAAHAHAESLHVHAFVANTHTAEAQDAARGIVVNELRPFFFRPVNFFFHEAAGIRAVAEDHVLQFALTAFVANWAIERVIRQEEFQHVLARVVYLFGSGAHDHAFGSHQGTCGLQLGHFFDFDQAHPAGGLQCQPRVIAERRNLGAQAAGRFDYKRSLGNLHVAVVDFQRDEFRVCHGSLPGTDQCIGGFVGAASLQVIFEFATEFLDDADGGHGCGVAQRAECPSKHVFREFADGSNVLRATVTGVKALQHLAQPGGAFAAGNAPAAGFMRVEMHDAAGQINHAGVFVIHDHAAGTEHRTGLGQGVIVHGHVDLVASQQGARTAARDNGFNLLAAGNATSDFIDELTHVHAEWNFVNAGLVHVPGDAQQARAAVLWRASLRVCIAAFQDDGWYRAERFHVVNDGGAAIQADDGREGRLDARIAALAFQRFH